MTPSSARTRASTARSSWRTWPTAGRSGWSTTATSNPFAGRVTAGITIGERDHWGGGYGSEALRLLLGHLFGACGFRRVELDTWSGNERAIRAFRKAGFVEEGRRRSAVRVGQRWYDSVLFGMLSEEWERLSDATAG